MHVAIAESHFHFSTVPLMQDPVDAVQDLVKKMTKQQILAVQKIIALKRSCKEVKCGQHGLY